MANRRTAAGGPRDDGDPFQQLAWMRWRIQRLVLDARRIWKSLNRLEERADALVQELQSLLSDTAAPVARG